MPTTSLANEGVDLAAKSPAGFSLFQSATWSSSLGALLIERIAAL
jgi:hypothetical protein